MMALLLPQCAPPESLHRLANARRQRSRKSARASHGATQSSTSTLEASTDHFKIPSTEPCCNLISPLVMTARKPARRPSRLRVRRESREDVKTDTETDAAEWYSRVLANNGAVEVDPVTMAEQMQHTKHYQADSNDYNSTNHNNNTYYHYGSSSETHDVYPSRNPGFPARVPLGVALAAGSAVALAIIALLIQVLHKEREETNSKSSDSEGSNLASSFKGKPVAPDLPSKVSHQAKNSKEVLASSAAAGGAAAAAAGASFSNSLAPNKMPSPPSLSKGEKSWSQSKYASVTPFFASDRSTTSVAKPAPPPVSRWQEDKYKSVRPFFPDDVAASTETVVPGKIESASPANKTVTPFFADDQPDSKNAKGSASLQSTPPSFAEDQPGSKNAKGSGSASLQNITPFFPDEQQSSRNGPSTEPVTPFFPDEQQGQNSTVVSQSEGPSKVENVKPFFPDEQEGSKKKSSVWSQFWDARSAKKGSSTASPHTTVDLKGNAPVKPSESMNQSATPILENTLSGTVMQQSEGKQMLKELAGKRQEHHKEFMKGATEERLAPGVARTLTSEDFALLEDIKAEEERRFAKMQALQAAFPALAIGAGAVGALVGVDGAFEMVGLTATASFVSYELLWANKRKELVDEISRITDHHELFSFLQKRKIVKDDC